MPEAECESAVLRRPPPHRNPFRLESEEEDPADVNEKSGLTSKREKPNQTRELVLANGRARREGAVFRLRPQLRDCLGPLREPRSGVTVIQLAVLATGPPRREGGAPP